MITISNRLTLTEGRGIYDRDQITEEPCDGKLSRTDLQGRREVVISPADPNYWMLSQLEALRPTSQKYGWETAQIRVQLDLEKQKSHKGDAVPQTHAVDGIALAASQFVEYQSFHTVNTHGHHWVGECQITPAPFAIIRRPPISRRQLQLMVPSKGGIRRKYGGTTTRHGVRKGDFVQAEQAGRIFFGWVSGDTERQISVSDIDWKRLGQFTARKVQLLQRSTGLLVNTIRRAAFLSGCVAGVPPVVAPRVPTQIKDLNGVSCRDTR